MRGRNVLDDRLVEAANRGDLDGIRQALEAGADVHAHNDWALRCAARQGSMDTVRELLAAGANPLAEEGKAALWAADNGNLDIVDLLVSAGAAMPKFPLNGAAGTGKLTILRVWVESRGICGVEDLHAAAYWAMLHCQRETFLYLVAAGGWKPFVSNPNCSALEPERTYPAEAHAEFKAGGYGFPRGNFWDGIKHLFTHDYPRDIADSVIFEIADLACFFASITNTDLQEAFSGYIQARRNDYEAGVYKTAKLERWLRNYDALHRQHEQESSQLAGKVENEENRSGYSVETIPPSGGTIIICGVEPPHPDLCRKEDDKWKRLNELFAEKAPADVAEEFSKFSVSDRMLDGYAEQACSFSRSHRGKCFRASGFEGIGTIQGSAFRVGYPPPTGYQAHLGEYRKIFWNLLHLDDRRDESMFIYRLTEGQAAYAAMSKFAQQEWQNWLLQIEMNVPLPALKYTVMTSTFVCSIERSERP